MAAVDRRVRAGQILCSSHYTRVEYCDVYIGRAVEHMSRPSAQLLCSSSYIVAADIHSLAIQSGISIFRHIQTRIGLHLQFHSLFQIPFGLIDIDCFSFLSQCPCRKFVAPKSQSSVLKFSYQMHCPTPWRRALFYQLVVVHLFKPEGSLPLHRPLSLYPEIVISSVSNISTFYFIYIRSVDQLFSHCEVLPSVGPTDLALCISCSY